MGNRSYLFRRILTIIPQLIGITLLAFVIAHAVPNDPANANLSQRALGDPEIVAAFREKWGLDRPLYEQYFTFLTNLFRGELGQSISTHQAVAKDIGQYLPATIELATFAIFFGILVGVLLGAVCAMYYNSMLDIIIRGFGFLGLSFPAFVLALIALKIFHVQLGWVAGPGRLDVELPVPPKVTGFYTIDSALAGQWATFGNAISHLILPTFVLDCYLIAILSRMTRSAMLEVLGSDFIRTARAKGLSSTRVLWGHALRNSLLPVVTIIGLQFGTLLTGAVLTESIFAWPGIGRYMFRASISQDYPAIMGVSLIIAVIYVVVNLVVDLLYYFIDPRLQTEKVVR